MEEQDQQIEKTEAEHKHAIDRRDTLKVSQCKNHIFRKLTENEVACIQCPTVLIVNNTKDYVKE